MIHTNKQDQRPAFQFYPKDWLSDTGLRCCSPAARGLWMDMLCIMWSSPKRGSLLTPANVQIACKSLQNLTCISSANDVQTYLDELEEHGVFSRLDDGTIINRRMYFQAQRENDISEKRRIAACKSHANRQQKSPAKPAAPTPTATPTATAKTKPSCVSWFDTDWKSYPRKDGKKAARRHYLASVKTDANRDRFQAAQANYIQYLAHHHIKPQYVKTGATFYNNWEDWVDYKEPGPGGKPGRKPPYFYAHHMDGVYLIYCLVDESGGERFGERFTVDKWADKGVPHAKEYDRA